MDTTRGKITSQKEMSVVEARNWFRHWREYLRVASKFDLGPQIICEVRSRYMSERVKQ